eukprot:1607386-Pleurochrysis_carterae.AAC.1
MERNNGGSGSRLDAQVDLSLLAKGAVGVIALLVWGCEGVLQQRFSGPACWASGVPWHGVSCWVVPWHQDLCHV